MIQDELAMVDLAKTADALRKAIDGEEVLNEEEVQVLMVLHTIIYDTLQQITGVVNEH